MQFTMEDLLWKFIYIFFLNNGSLISDTSKQKQASNFEPAAVNLVAEMTAEI